MYVRAIHEPGTAGSVQLRALTTGGGELAMVRDRQGSGWIGAASLLINGQRDGYITSLTLLPSELRRLADFADRLAAFIEARQAGRPAPCTCSAWGHGLTPCTNTAADDYVMCRECWSPEGGQSALDMSHG